jgi:hypothetical protein
MCLSGIKGFSNLLLVKIPPRTGEVAISLLCCHHHEEKQAVMVFELSPSTMG